MEVSCTSIIASNRCRSLFKSLFLCVSVRQQLRKMGAKAQSPVQVVDVSLVLVMQ